jgi:hypothetical protein
MEIHRARVYFVFEPETFIDRHELVHIVGATRSATRRIKEQRRGKFHCKNGGFFSKSGAPRTLDPGRCLVNGTSVGVALPIRGPNGSLSKSGTYTNNPGSDGYDG